MPACRAFLAGGEPGPTYNIEPVPLDGPKDWVYEVDGLSTTIASTVFVDANVTLSGVTERPTLHFKLNDAGGLEWFTDCGTPPASP